MRRKNYNTAKKKKNDGKKNGIDYKLFVKTISDDVELISSLAGVHSRSLLSASPHANGKGTRHDKKGKKE